MEEQTLIEPITDDPKSEPSNEVAESKELRAFYKVLAAVQANAIFRVVSARDDEDMKKRAVDLTDKLSPIANLYYGGKCGKDHVWNSATGRCEPKDPNAGE